MSQQSLSKTITETLDESVSILNDDIDKCFDAAIRWHETAPDRAQSYQRRANYLNISSIATSTVSTRLKDIQVIVLYYSNHTFDLNNRPQVFTDTQWNLINEVSKGNPIASLEDSFSLFKDLLAYPM